MDEEFRRPQARTRDTAVSRERPHNARGPQPPRRQTGTASEQAAARRKRLAAQAEAQTRQPAGRHAADPRGEVRRPARIHQENTRQADPRANRQTERQKAPRNGANAAGQRNAARKKKKPHRIYNTNFGFKFGTMLLVVAVIVLSMIIFFKVKHIAVQNTGTGGRTLIPGATGAAPAQNPDADLQVDGNSYYTAQEIIDASGINIDDNLLTLSKANVASKIHAALPYINEIQIQKKLPSRVIIKVSEFTVTYGIQDVRGGWWLMSRDGRILEQADEQTVKDHLIVTGMPILAPEIGDYIEPAAADGADMAEIAAKRSAIVAVLPMLEQASYAEQIVSLDVSTSYDLVIWYGTQFEIRLGNTENLSYKLNYLDAVLKELKDKTGTIDLTFHEDDGAHFLPFG